MTDIDVYLSLGSNIGERRWHLRRAIQALLQHPGLALHSCSAIYETKPFGPIAQRSFWNLCLRLELSAAQFAASASLPQVACALLQHCQQCEQQLGRARRGPRWGPRTIDIDLIDCGQLRYHSQTLILPHPYFLERLFVLVPLAEIASAEFLAVYCADLCIEKRIAELEARPENRHWGHRVQE